MEMEKERLHMQESLAEVQTSLTAIQGSFFLFHYYIVTPEDFPPDHGESSIV